MSGTAGWPFKAPHADMQARARGAVNPDGGVKPKPQDWLDLVRKWEAQRLITRQEGWELRTYETLPDFLSGRLPLARCA